MNKTLKRFLRVALEIAVIVALAAAIPWALAKALHTEHPLATITSESMWPALKRGDMVLIRGSGAGDVRVGSIVVYRGVQDSSMIIHRVVKIDGLQVVTKGDANDEEDEPIAVSDIAGVVATVRGRPVHIPYLGYLTLLVRGSPSE